MSQKRKQHSPAFKAKVALAAIRGDETIAQLSARHGLHPTQINTWKRQLQEQAAGLFDKGHKQATQEVAQVDELHRVIGQLTVERDFLSRKLNH